MRGMLLSRALLPENTSLSRAPKLSPYNVTISKRRRASPLRQLVPRLLTVRPTQSISFRKTMLARAAGLVPGLEEYHDHAASKQLQLESSMEAARRREADARQGLLAVLNNDFGELVNCDPK
jgi:hypothetical protein